MTEPQDAALIAALETQQRQLTAVLHRLEVARRDLVPARAGIWRGPARRAYDSALETITTTVDAGLTVVRSARENTAAAIAGVAGRG
ncbi:MAG: hypothetical protein JWP19_2125 [Rhodoglobus sp.]|nr:hypothetical protein [Rhodoglobus sp.]